MRILIDTHSLIWAIDDFSKLGSHAIAAMQDPTNDLILSSGSIWEISIKYGLSKLKLYLPFRNWIEKAIADLDLFILPITLDHADRQAGLTFHHSDPFDRLFAAQSLVEGIPIISADPIFDHYGVKRLWR